MGWGEWACGGEGIWRGGVMGCASGWDYPLSAYSSSLQVCLGLSACQPISRPCPGEMWCTVSWLVGRCSGEPSAYGDVGPGMPRTTQTCPSDDGEDSLLSNLTLNCSQKCVISMNISLHLDHWPCSLELGLFFCSCNAFFVVKLAPVFYIVTKALTEYIWCKSSWTNLKKKKKKK